MKTSLLIFSMLFLSLLNLSADKKTVTHQFGALSLETPSTWKKEEPKSSMRAGQFSIPATQKEGQASELVIFYFGQSGGGGLEANFKRWEGQFDAEGRKTKRSKGQSQQGPYHMIDISGTFNKSIGPPIMRKTKAMPNARVISIIIETKKGNYFLKLVGKQDEIEKTYPHLMKSIGADNKNK